MPRRLGPRQRQQGGGKPRGREKGKKERETTVETSTKRTVSKVSSNGLTEQTDLLGEACAAASHCDAKHLQTQ